jgi:hypothetical protein
MVSFMLVFPWSKVTYDNFVLKPEEKQRKQTKSNLFRLAESKEKKKVVRFDSDEP